MIAGNLEYLINSLPDLAFRHDKEVQERVEYLLQTYAGHQSEQDDLVSFFVGEAIKFLSDREAEQLQIINLQSIHESRFQDSRIRLVREYAEFIYAFKGSLATYRMARRDSTTQHSSAKHTPIKQGTPLEEEVQVLQIQWEKLEELASGHHYDLEALIIYKLHLEILQRYWSFDEGKGMDIFKSITEKTEHG
ncbi:MAG: DUF2764 family protein [Saprospiraceae bacterium]|nr:DUF2764 family protein [Saprospiraceae bacterium]